MLLVLSYGIRSKRVFHHPFMRRRLIMRPSFMFWYYRVFPHYDKVHRRKIVLWRMCILTSLAAGLVTFFIGLIGWHHHAEPILLMVFCMLLVQFVALLPLTWWLYTTSQTRKNTMLNLQMALEPVSCRPGLSSCADQSAFPVQRLEHALRHSLTGKCGEYQRRHSEAGRYDAFYTG